MIKRSLDTPICFSLRSTDTLLCMTDSKPQPAVGIDLGTTFSAVAFLDAQGRPETIRNSEGDLTTPSAVFFDHKRPIVGLEAVEAGLL
ncbi:MAG: Hsp70 family protein, partial [Planctomycetales bacterium]|nr:Hsp70 family protein [Planctomycetales bacterium]